MTTKKRPDPIESVKAQLRRKALDAKGGKPLPAHNAKRKPVVKPAKNPAMFDPDAFKGDQPIHQLGRQPKGVQPEWVKQQYGEYQKESQQ